MSPGLDPDSSARIACLEDGATARLDGRGGSLIALRRQGETRVYRNRCPHRGTELDWNPGAFLAPDGHHLQCATHAALFDPMTGVCISGPCAGDRLERIDWPAP